MSVSHGRKTRNDRLSRTAVTDLTPLKQKKKEKKKRSKNGRKRGARMLRDLGVFRDRARTQFRPRCHRHAARARRVSSARRLIVPRCLNSSKQPAEASLGCRLHYHAVAMATADVAPRVH